MTQFVTAPDGVRIAYEAMGEGPAILLVHGFASDRVQNWKAPGWYDTLVGRRIIALDCRGHGESAKPHEPEAYGDRMIGDLIAVAEAEAAGGADVMGYSMGAMLTIGLLMCRPDLVRRAVVAGVGETYFTSAPEWRHGIADALEVADPATIADPVQRMFRLFASQRGKDLTALAACMRSPRTVYSPEELKRVERPVLVVCGETDQITGSPDGLAVAFPNGRAFTVPRRDHMTTVGDKGYKNAVLEFLAS
jgi:pimeloyl-ACP methyl ester carboxylesterase